MRIRRTSVGGYEADFGRSCDGSIVFKELKHLLVLRGCTVLMVLGGFGWSRVRLIEDGWDYLLVENHGLRRKGNLSR